MSKHQSSLEKLFLDTILLKCENYVLRGVASSCLVKVATNNKQSIQQTIMRHRRGQGHVRAIVRPATDRIRVAYLSACTCCLCLQLLSLNSHNVSNWYHDLLKLLEGKEQSGRIIGLQW